jgi:hypothetical protein
LHGIPSWARSERAYLELLQTLSKETWGISISLLDMISNPKEVLQKSIQVGKKKGEKEDELMFKEYDKFIYYENCFIDEYFILFCFS